ncbi:MAG: hypothetical protein XD91_1558 [Clostridiales bacterium 38_11]|nr:MAG: hypothetical protein XD91_1558 [Clostridiales bacterium 38_11]
MNKGKNKKGILRKQDIKHRAITEESIAGVHQYGF